MLPKVVEAAREMLHEIMLERSHKYAALCTAGRHLYDATELTSCQDSLHTSLVTTPCSLLSWRRAGESVP